MGADDIKVAIADDHEMIRIGLERVISIMSGMRVVAQCADANEVLRADFNSVDVLLLDMNMPGSDGLPLLKRVVERYPDLRVIVFSMLPEDSFASRALAAGAAAFVNKNQPPEQVIKAIRSAYESGRYISEAQEDLFLSLETKSDESLHDQLSQREYEILLLISAGRKPTDIAESLDLRVGTVSTHIHRIKRKLGVNSLGEIVAYGHRHRLMGN